VCWATVVAARARSSSPSQNADAEIEAALPEIEGARLANRLPQVHPRYLDRTDRAGQVLSAWTLADDQEVFNTLHGMSNLDHYEVWADIGSAAVYIRWKTYDQAVAALTRARSKSPKIAEGAVLEGDLDRLRGDAVAAERAYREALSLRSNDSFAFDGLGLLAQSAGHWDDADRDFTQAKAVFAGDPVADRGLADARVARGDLAGALSALDDLHRLLPNDTDAWVESGKLRLKRGDPAAATDFQQARRLGSSDPELLRLLTQTYRAQGRTDDERSLIDDLVSQNVADARHYARRAELREATDVPGALSDLRRAVSIDPQDLDIQTKLAVLTAKTGDLAGAIGLYRGLVDKKPALKADLMALEKRAGLSGKPLRGSVNEINQGLSTDLTALFHQLLKQTPGLQGALKIRVIVGSDGRAQSEELLENSVRSPELAANLRWNAHDARYPPTAARYVFKFALK